MDHLYNEPRLKDRRRRLRRKQTFAEKILWSQLRGRGLDGYKFYRQYGVGYYTLDFYCHTKRLAVELDGPGHFVGAGPERDARRTAFLNRCNIRVIRFRNEEVFEKLNDVIAEIRRALEDPRATESSVATGGTPL